LNSVANKMNATDIHNSTSGFKVIYITRIACSFGVILNVLGLKNNAQSKTYSLIVQFYLVNKILSDVIECYFISASFFSTRF